MGGYHFNINDNSFSYVPGELAQSYFSKITSLSWENFQSPSVIDFLVFNVRTRDTLSRPALVGTNGIYSLPQLELAWASSNPYSSKLCSCGCKVSHELLRVQKTFEDLRLLKMQQVPMPEIIMRMKDLTDPAAATSVGKCRS